MKKFWKFILTIIIAVAAYGYEAYDFGSEAHEAISLLQGQLEVKLLDVGHGDAILLRNQAVAILVDTGDYKNDYKHIVQELLYPEDIEKFTAQLDFDVLSANYNNTPDYSGCECRFVGADGVAQWYEIRVYYWFGRSRVLITVRNVNDAHDYLDEEYEKMLCRSAGLCKRM